MRLKCSTISTPPIISEYKFLIIGKSALVNASSEFFLLSLSLLILPFRIQEGSGEVPGSMRYNETSLVMPIAFFHRKICWHEHEKRMGRCNEKKKENKTGTYIYS